MLRPTHFFILVAGTAGFAASAAAQQTPLGTFGLWGAFQDPGRCYAIAQPVEGSMSGGAPFASVGYWPRQAGRGGARGQVHIRLREDKRPESAVLLRIDGRTFQLIGRGRDAWAPDAAADADLVSAIRSGVTMLVEARSARGRRMRDLYRLRGAPSAIDAAALACAPR